MLLIQCFISRQPAYAEEDIEKEQYRHRFLSEMTEIYQATFNTDGGLSLHGSHNDGHNQPVKKINSDQVLQISQAITNCHMAALALYPPELQRVVFQASSYGQDIESARRSFVRAINQKKQESAQQQEKMETLERRFIQQANPCISKALEGTPLSTHHNH